MVWPLGIVAIKLGHAGIADLSGHVGIADLSGHVGIADLSVLFINTSLQKHVNYQQTSSGNQKRYMSKCIK